MEFCLGLSPVARLIFVFINLPYSENEIVKYFIKLDQSNWKLIFLLCKCLCFGGLQHCTGFIYLLSFYDVLLDSTIPFHIIHIVIDKWIFLVHQLQRRRRRKKTTTQTMMKSNCFKFTHLFGIFEIEWCVNYVIAYIHWPTTNDNTANRPKIEKSQHEITYSLYRINFKLYSVFCSPANLL